MPHALADRLGPAPSRLLLVMAEAAILGGQEAKRRLRRLDPDAMTHKAARDYQTEADVAVEAMVSAHLVAAFPDHGILGEEHAADRTGAEGAPVFVIDPIDGTTNFAWGIPHFATVVTLVQGDTILAGVVYDPMLDELFAAERGKGATLEGRPLRVRDSDDLVNAVMSPCQPVPGQVKSVPVETYHAAIRRVMDHVAGCRRFGSAALSIAYVAAGRLDGFFEDGLGVNDYGASKLVVEEAGGRVTNFQGAAATGQSAILAAAPRYHQWLLDGFR